MDLAQLRGIFPDVLSWPTAVLPHGGPVPRRACSKVVLLQGGPAPRRSYPMAVSANCVEHLWETNIVCQFLLETGAPSAIAWQPTGRPESNLARFGTLQFPLWEVALYRRILNCSTVWCWLASRVQLYCNIAIYWTLVVHFDFPNRKQSSPNPYRRVPYRIRHLYKTLQSWTSTTEQQTNTHTLNDRGLIDSVVFHCHNIAVTQLSTRSLVPFILNVRMSTYSLSVTVRSLS